MKRLGFVLLMLLCVFSLSAEWGRIRYVDEFGDADPSRSNPYQIVNGTKYEYGVTNYDYKFRFLTEIPANFGSYASAYINIFDLNFNKAVFRNGGEIIVKVKLDSGKVLTIVEEFEEYEESIYFFGNDVSELINELYKGNNLKFVIYYGDAKYNFTIDGTGYKEAANEFLVDYKLPEPLRIVDREYYRGIQSCFTWRIKDVCFALRLCSDGIPGHENYPYLFASLYYKYFDDAIWYDNKGAFSIISVSIISSDGSVLSLAEDISEDRTGFDFWEDSDYSKVLSFSEVHDNLSLVMEIEPSYCFSIPVSKKDIQIFLTFSDLTDYSA